MYAQIRLSPDGKRATYVMEGDRDLWVLNVDGSRSPQKLSSGPARDSMPVWSGDGSTVFYTAGERNIYRVPSHRSTPPEVLLQLSRPERVHPTALTPDGKQLLTHWDIMPKAIDLRVLQLGPTRVLTRLIEDSHSDHDGRLSPDGEWIVYESGGPTPEAPTQVVVRRFTNIGAQQTVISAMSR